MTPPPGELATDRLEPGVAQDASFVEHRHDQSLLSLLAKKRGLKSYPLPTTTHDVRDVWAWEAGYCQPGFQWPLPPPTRTPTRTLTRTRTRTRTRTPNPNPSPNPSPSPNPNQVAAA